MWRTGTCKEKEGSLPKKLQISHVNENMLPFSLPHLFIYLFPVWVGERVEQRML